LLDDLKRSAKEMAETTARGLARTGATPTQLTLIGFGLNVAVAAVLAVGLLPLGGALLLLAGAFDTLDGALARISKRATTFGAFLDSTLDRYSEAALLLGLLYDASRRGDVAVSIVTYVAIVGSLLVSYCRARAEGLGLDCEIGIAPRPERVVALGLGLIAGLELPVLILLAVVTHLTAVQRILHVYHLTRRPSTPRPPVVETESRP
jgi:CDP-diacylglycerol---glycerol-3-phosphate 3-phosphatidyltransferase